MLSSRKLEQLLMRLARAMERQAEATALQAAALDRLAESNEDLVDELMERQDEMGDLPELDLAGRPLDS